MLRISTGVSMVAPAEERESFVPLFDARLDDILCLKYPRIVGNDNRVRYKGMSLQIPLVEDRYHFVRAKVMVHEHGDGRMLPIYHGKRRLGKYDKGRQVKKQRREEQTENPDKGSPQFYISLFGLRPVFASDYLRVHLTLVETHL